eukprot:Mrub_09274.p2 GENE.Mrub_09274~~Mrub_09274.p2  ORF type:complete len:119 (-),score=18.99 Mrub_09274:142-498(-)
MFRFLSALRFVPSQFIPANLTMPLVINTPACSYIINICLIEITSSFFKLSRVTSIELISSLFMSSLKRNSQRPNLEYLWDWPHLNSRRSRLRYTPRTVASKSPCSPQFGHWRPTSCRH